MGANQGPWAWPTIIRERDEAREAIAEANNSLFGSQAFFLSLSGGPADRYHLSRAIEELKARRAPNFSRDDIARAVEAELHKSWSTSEHWFTTRVREIGLAVADAILARAPDGERDFEAQVIAAAFALDVDGLKSRGWSDAKIAETRERVPHPSSISLRNARIALEAAAPAARTTLPRNEGRAN